MVILLNYHLLYGFSFVIFICSLSLFLADALHLITVYYLHLYASWKRGVGHWDITAHPDEKVTSRHCLCTYAGNTKCTRNIYQQCKVLYPGSDSQQGHNI